MTKKKIIFNARKIIRHPAFFAKSLMPFILSHHPECDQYKNDYIIVKGVKLCIGCTFVISTALLMFIIDLFVDLWGLYLVKYHVLFLVLGLSIEALYYTGLGRENKKIKIFSKIVLGAIIACIFIYILHANASTTAKAITFIYTYMLINAIISGTRIIHIERKCKKCTEYKDFPLCSGFRELLLKLENRGFVKIEIEDKY